MNVLLVDDDEIFNFLGKKILQRINFVNEVDTALNGKEAIRLFEEFFIGSKPLPDYILLDVNMPIMNGFEFLDAFSKLTLPQKEKIKIVMVSSSQDPFDMQRAKALGAKDYLIKPLAEGMLRGVLVAHHVK